MVVGHDSLASRLYISRVLAIKTGITSKLELM